MAYKYLLYNINKLLQMLLFLYNCLSLFYNQLLPFSTSLRIKLKIIEIYILINFHFIFKLSLSKSYKEK